MSLLLPEYLVHLQNEMDEDDDDIPAEEMTPEVRRFCDRMFVASLKSKKTPAVPDPTDVPPGPLKVAVMRKRFAAGQMLFHPALDFRWDQVKARIGCAVTVRATDNDRPLEDDIVEEREIQDELRADEAAHKARRDGAVILPFAPRKAVRQ